LSEVEVNDGTGWRPVASVPVALSPSTPADGIEAEVVYVDAVPERIVEDRDLDGRIVLLWGQFGQTPEKLEQVRSGGAAAVIWVDDRLPVHWLVAIGTPYDWRRYLTIPQVSIPYFDGWRLAQAPGARARIRTSVWQRPSQSVNVFADIPGTGEGIVHLGAHLDTVILGTGADDDASGVAAALDIARMFAHADTQPLSTIRFVLYGAEEELSEGARQYVLAHQEAIQRSHLCVNFDAIGSIVGHNQVAVTGPEELAQAARETPDYPCQVNVAFTPYSDMFPYNIFGVPSLWYYRVNMPNFRYFHHSEHDDLPNVSAAQIARTATAAAHLTCRAACQEPTWARTIPAEQAEELAKRAASFYGM
ncbi:MAG: M20/M25/M40 family metallo-hydrolase, partial [Armatimonadota bacterium]